MEGPGPALDTQSKKTFYYTAKETAVWISSQVKIEYGGAPQVWQECTGWLLD